MKDHNRALQEAGYTKAERRAVMSSEMPASAVGDASKVGRPVMVNGVDVRNLRRACFVAGTPVETRDGLRAIDRLAIGDQVLSRHEETGEIAYRTVVRTIVIDDKQIYRLVVADPAGNRETIRTTDEHPFWIADHGWVRAADLREGDPLLAPSGDDRVVVSLVEEEVLETVYNIEVDEFHTYFVGVSRVFVHNADCGEVEIVSSGPAKVAQRTGKSSTGASAIEAEQVAETTAKLTPQSFGYSTVAENEKTLKMWNDAMRSAANSRRENGYMRYLDALAKGETPDQKMLEQAFGAVNSRFMKAARAEGMEVAEVHHWNYGKIDYPTQVVDPRNLVPVPTRAAHEALHRATSLTTDIWAGRINPQHVIDIDGWYTPLAPR